MMVSMDSAMTGQVISHFRLLDKLGEGGMGEVYRAEDTLLRRIVALKFLTSSNASERSMQARFLREAQAGAGLDHPNICPVYGFEQIGERSFIVMAFVDGAPLSRRMHEGITLREAVEWTIGIGEGLKHAHDYGIVHRDIKAANILISKSGIPRITDFGLAKIQDRSRLTVPGSVMGTISCMAPEQLMAEDADRRTDIWAWGVLFYEMLTGCRPFDRGSVEKTMRAILSEQAPPLNSFEPLLPSDLNWMLQKAMSKSRSERYQHADDFITDLRVARKRLKPEHENLALRPASSGGAPTRSKTLRSASRLPGGLGWPMAITAVLLFGVLVALFVYMLR